MILSLVQLDRETIDNSCDELVASGITEKNQVVVGDVLCGDGRVRLGAGVAAVFLGEGSGEPGQLLSSMLIDNGIVGSAGWRDAQERVEESVVDGALQIVLLTQSRARSGDCNLPVAAARKQETRGWPDFKCIAVNEDLLCRRGLA